MHLPWKLIRSFPSALKARPSGANEYPPKKPFTKRAKMTSSVTLLGSSMVVERVSVIVTCFFGFTTNAAFDWLKASGI